MGWVMVNSRVAPGSQETGRSYNGCGWNGGLGWEADIDSKFRQPKACDQTNCLQPLTPRSWIGGLSRPAFQPGKKVGDLVVGAPTAPPICLQKREHRLIGLFRAQRWECSHFGVDFLRGGDRKLIR